MRGIGRPHPLQYSLQASCAPQLYHVLQRRHICWSESKKITITSHIRQILLHTLPLNNKIYYYRGGKSPTCPSCWCRVILFPHHMWCEKSIQQYPTSPPSCKWGPGIFWGWPSFIHQPWFRWDLGAHTIVWERWSVLLQLLALLQEFASIGLECLLNAQAARWAAAQRQQYNLHFAFLHFCMPICSTYECMYNIGSN